MKVSWGMRKWTDDEMERSLRVLAEQSFETYLVPLEVLARHPETRYAVVDYAELVAEPRRTIERVYAELGIPVTKDFAAALDEEQARAREHVTRHRYSLEEFGLREGEIRERLAPLFERFGWDAPAPREAASGEG